MVSAEALAASLGVVADRRAVHSRLLYILFFKSTNYWAFNLLAQICTAASFVLGGYFYVPRLVPILTQHALIILIGASAAAVAILKVSVAETMVMSWSTQPNNPILQLTITWLFIVSVLAVSTLAAQIKLLCRIGDYTRSIMAGHLFIFSVMNVVLADMNTAPLTATFIFSPSWAWPGYLIAGVFGPIAITYLVSLATDLFGRTWTTRTTSLQRSE